MLKPSQVGIMAAKKTLQKLNPRKIEHLTDAKGKPKHTRFYKNYFYAFRKQLIKDFGPKQLDMLYCSKPGPVNLKITICLMVNATVMELDHINRDTSDSRPENLRSLCALHHQQTLGYKNR